MATIFTRQWREVTLSLLKYPLAEKFPAASLMFQQLGKFFLLSLRPKISLLREPEIVTSLLEPTSRAFTSESWSASPQDSSEEFRLKCIVFVHTLILHWINIKEL